MVRRASGQAAFSCQNEHAPLARLAVLSP